MIEPTSQFQCKNWEKFRPELLYKLAIGVGHTRQAPHPTRPNSCSLCDKSNAKGLLITGPNEHSCSILIN